MSLTIEVELKEFLTRLENKIDKVEAKVDNIQKDIIELKVDLTEVKTRLVKVEKDVTDLKTTQKNQLWAVISILSVAVFSTVVRFVFDGLPKTNL